MLVLAASGPCQSAWAATARSSAWTASLTLTSDYVLRGVSQSDGQPAVQGDISLALNTAWQVGVWGSSVRTLPGHRSTELDVYLARHWAPSADVGVAVTLTRYAYPGDDRPISYNYDELNLSLNWQDSWLFSAAWSPDTSLVSVPDHFITHQQTLTLAGGYHRALTQQMEMTAGIGYFRLLEQHEGHYGFGSIGASYHVGRVRADLDWFWTQGEQHRVYVPGPAGGPWALTLSCRF